MKYATLILLLVGLSQSAVAEEVTSTPLGVTGTRVRALTAPDKAMREYGFEDDFYGSKWVLHELEFNGERYGLVFASIPDGYLVKSIANFRGIVQKIGRDRWRFIPYTGKQRFAHSHALAMTHLPSGELALWFQLRGEVNSFRSFTEKLARTDRERYVDLREQVNRGVIPDQLREVWPESHRITFSSERNIFTDEDVMMIDAGSTKYYPEHLFGDGTGPHNFRALWQWNDSEQWTRYEYPTYSELSRWTVLQGERVLLEFQLAELAEEEEPADYRVQMAVFDRRMHAFTEVVHFQ